MSFDNLSMLSSIISYILLIVGSWQMFKKSKIKKWYSLIPFVNEYQLAKSGDCEDEASVYAFLSVILPIISGFYSYIVSSDKIASLTGYMVGVLMVILDIVALIYYIRIAKGLCETYQKSKKWIWGWLFFRGITAVIWGFSDKFLPSFVMEEESKENEAGSKKVAALEEGLTININKRTARKGFSTKVMLKDINLAIEPGKMVLLLGGSGAGKTTFFNAVTGYEPADAKILLNGQDVYKHFSKMKYEIGLVPQQELIRVNDTVYRTLMDAAMLRLPSSVSSEERHKRVEEVMELFGLSSIKDNIVQKQSGGQKKRISIAMEYISDPSLFILDEPDSGLDGILARELMQRLHNISREGKIVIVITHTPDRVIDLFDQVIVLAKDEKRTGRLVYFGDVDDARKFFGKDKMEDIIKMINRPDEGGDGKSDELIKKFAEARNGKE